MATATCTNLGCWFVGGDDLNWSFARHIAPVTITSFVLAPTKSRMETFWYRLTQVVLKNGRSASIHSCIKSPDDNWCPQNEAGSREDHRHIERQFFVCAQALSAVVCRRFRSSDDRRRIRHRAGDARPQVSWRCSSL